MGDKENQSDTPLMPWTTSLRRHEVDAVITGSHEQDMTSLLTSVDPGFGAQVFLSSKPQYLSLHSGERKIGNQIYLKPHLSWIFQKGHFFKKQNKIKQNTVLFISTGIP